MNYRYQEHAADIGISATSDSREGLLEELGTGLSLLLFSKLPVGTGEAASIHATGNSSEEVMVNWLNELLYLMQDERHVPVSINVSGFSSTEAIGRMIYQAFNPSIHAVIREIKAVTFHLAMIRSDDNGWRAEVVLDL